MKLAKEAAAAGVEWCREAIPAYGRLVTGLRLKELRVLEEAKSVRVYHPPPRPGRKDPTASTTKRTRPG